MKMQAMNVEERLAQQARSMAAGGDVLFHGTRYPSAIFGSGALLPDNVGDDAVFFTRSPEEAAFWATLPRGDDEGRGAIFVFDRRRLTAIYKLHPSSAVDYRDEYEERIWSRPVRLKDACIGLVSEPFSIRTPKQRKLAYEHRTAIQRCSGCYDNW